MLNEPGCDTLEFLDIYEWTVPKVWESRAVRDWCSDHGVILEVAPAESHNWLGVVERRHQVVRRALEIYMEDEGEANLTNLKEAAIYVPPRNNQMSFCERVHTNPMGSRPSTCPRTIADCRALQPRD